MKNLISIFCFLIVTVLFFACKNNDHSACTSNSDSLSLAKNIVAEKIQYEISLEKNEDRPTWLEKLDSKKFVGQLLDNVISGKFKVYDYFTKAYLTQKEIDNLVQNRVDTTLLPNSEGVNEQRLVKHEFDPSDIKSLLFIEKWYFDAEKGMMQKKVVGIGLVKHYMAKKDGETEKICKDLLFVIDFDTPAKK